MAIDFGTAASGYAYSHSHTKDDVKINPNWGAAAGVQSYKAPTNLSVKNGKFFAFGLEALQQYVENEGNDMQLFREFKMQLAGQVKLSLF